MTGGFRRGMLQTVKILSEWTIKSFYLQKYKILGNDLQSDTYMYKKT